MCLHRRLWLRAEGHADRLRRPGLHARRDGRSALPRHCTGKVVWQKNFVRDYGAEVPLYGFASPPLVDGERLITMVGGQGQAVVALDRHTGKELWKAGSASEPGYCAPLIRTLGGQRQLIVWLADALMGLEPETGQVRWTIPHPLDGRDGHHHAGHRGQSAGGLQPV